MMTIQVDKPFPVTIPDPEGPRLEWWPGGPPILTIAFYNPSPAEIDAIQNGDCEFGLVDKFRVGITWFLFKFGAMAWADAPYSIHRATHKPDLDVLQSDNDRLVLNVVLVDLADGQKVKAIRLITLSPAFSQRLIKELKQQLDEPKLTNDQYDRRIVEVCKQFPMTINMLPYALLCKGGE
jgi:hypothetical protein